MAATYQRKYPSAGLTYGGATYAWTNPTNIYANDGSYASQACSTTASQNDYLVAHNFGFSLPSGATIVAVVAIVSLKSGGGSGSSSSLFETAELGTYTTGTSTWSTLGNNQGSTLINNFYNTAGWTTSIIGGTSASVWGATLTDTIVNGSDFGIRIRLAPPGATTLYVDSIMLQIIYNETTTSAYTIAGTGATDGSGSTTAWVNSTNITAQDTSYATCTMPGSSSNVATIYDYIHATNFGFSLPSSAEITGIKISVRRRRQAGSTGSIYDDDVRVLVAGTKSGRNLAQPGQSWGTIVTTKDYGALYYNCDLDLTGSDVNNSNFGVAFRVVGSIAGTNRRAEIDSIYITLTYTTPYTIKVGSPTSFTMSLPSVIPDDGNPLIAQECYTEGNGTALALGSGQGWVTPKANSLLLAMLGVLDGNTSSVLPFTNPTLSGFTKIVSTEAENYTAPDYIGAYSAMYYKIAAGTETTFTMATSGAYPFLQIGMLEIWNADTASIPYETHTGTASSSLTTDALAGGSGSLYLVNFVDYPLSWDSTLTLGEGFTKFTSTSPYTGLSSLYNARGYKENGASSEDASLSATTTMSAIAAVLIALTKAGGTATEIDVDVKAFLQTLNAPNTNAIINSVVKEFIQTLVDTNTKSTISGDVRTFTQTLNDNTLKSIINNDVKGFTQTLNDTNAKSTLSVDLETFTQTLIDVFVNQKTFLEVAKYEYQQTLNDVNAWSTINPDVKVFLQTLVDAFINAQTKVDVNTTAYNQTFYDVNAKAIISIAVQMYIQQLIDGLANERVEASVRAFTQSLYDLQANATIRPDVKAFLQTLIDVDVRTGESLYISVISFLQTLLSPNTNVAYKPDALSFLMTLVPNNVVSIITPEVYNFIQNGTQDGTIVGGSIVGQECGTIVGGHLLPFDCLQHSVLLTLDFDVKSFTQSLNEVNAKSIIQNSAVAFLMTNGTLNATAIVRPDLIEFIQQQFNVDVFKQEFIAIPLQGFTQGLNDVNATSKLVLVPLAQVLTMFDVNVNSIITPDALQVFLTLIENNVKQTIGVDYISFTQVNEDLVVKLTISPDAVSFIQTLNDPNANVALYLNTLAFIQALQHITTTTDTGRIVVVFSWDNVAFNSDNQVEITTKTTSVEINTRVKGTTTINESSALELPIQTEQEISLSVGEDSSTSLTINNVAMWS